MFVDRKMSQLALRTSKDLDLISGYSSYEALAKYSKPEQVTRCCAYSQNGDFFVFVSGDVVRILSAETGEQAYEFALPNVYEVAFSPKSSYLCTWERPSKDVEGNPVRNHKIWNYKTGKMLVSFFQKSQSSWNVQYTADEGYFARCILNEVQFYRSASPEDGICYRLKQDGVASFAICPGRNPALAVFIPELKGSPAIVRIFTIPNFGQPVAQKTFFRADKVQFKWNALGTSVLVLTQTEVDKTGKSYYGETQLYLLSTAGAFDCRVALDKEGPVHDVTWSPSSKEFGVVYGYMPAKTTLFDQRANSLHAFGAGSRNTVLFSPNGKYILIAGFGNLQGVIEVYDRTEGVKKVSSFEASNSSVCDWSPDGRFILTGTTSPRLRVDNGVKIWHVSGTLIFRRDMTELYQILWRPQQVDKISSRSASPAPEPHASAADFAAKQTTSKPAGAYRPPSARAGGSSFSINRDEPEIKSAVANGSSAGTRTPIRSSYVPGFAPKQNTIPGFAPKQNSIPGFAPKVRPQDDKPANGTTKTDADTKPIAFAESNRTLSGDANDEKKARALLKKLRSVACFHLNH